MTHLSAQWLAQRVRGPRTSLGRRPRNAGSWCRPRLPPLAGLGCFGWLPPAYQPVTWWGKCCEAALAIAAKNCEKRPVED